MPLNTRKLTVSVCVEKQHVYPKARVAHIYKRSFCVSGLSIHHKFALVTHIMRMTWALVFCGVVLSYPHAPNAFIPNIIQGVQIWYTCMCGCVLKLFLEVWGLWSSLLVVFKWDILFEFDQYVCEWDRPVCKNHTHLSNSMSDHIFAFRRC